MLDITNKTQAQVEELFSMESARETLAISMAELIDQITDEHYELLRASLNTTVQKAESLMYDLVEVLSNPALIPVSSSGNRTATHKQMVQIISKLFTHYNEDYTERQTAVLAGRVMTAMSGILFDANVYAQSVETVLVPHADKDLIPTHYNTQDLPEGILVEQPKVIYNVGMGVVPETVQAKMGLSRFRLPLIETPVEWTTASRGGYHDTDRQRAVTIKGNPTQPTLVLEAINKLQRQVHTTTGSYNHEEQYNTILTKQLAKGKSNAEASDIATHTTVTAKETYDLMDGKDYYFEYRMDFRGRVYETGYDIAIQGDSYKKSMSRAKRLTNTERASLELLLQGH